MEKKLFSLAKSPIGNLIVGIAFGKFSKLLPVKRIKETDRIIAFWHPKPYWEMHILIVPKKAIKDMVSIKPGDIDYINSVYEVVSEIVRELRWMDKGYTLLANGGKRQEVNQLHFHLHSGERISRST